MSTKYNYIDLFSGCGGLSLGLLNAGWKGLFAIEKSKDAFSTLKYNLIDNKQHYEWPDWLPIENHDIKEVLVNYRTELENLQDKVSLVAGGPPCQGFSTAGRRNENDDRNNLMDFYIEFISIIKPRFLLFENVRGFTIGFKKKKRNTTERGKPYSILIKEQLENLGYNVIGKIVDFSKFGVPQRRKRFILIGCLDENPEIFFEKINIGVSDFLKQKKLKNNVTLEEAISDLLKKHGCLDSPDTKNFKAGIYGESQSKYQKYLREGKSYAGEIADSHRFTNHKDDTVKIFKNIIEKAPKNARIDGDMRKEYDLRRRGVFLLDKNSICPTLTTNPDDYIHYCEPRILTVREYARIQSFPDWYHFKGKYTTGGKKRVLEVPRYTQLGNAIPPLFSEQAGIALKEML